MRQFFSPILTLLISLSFGQAVLARPETLSLNLERQGKESYPQMLQRASNLAKTTIEQRLKADASIDRLDLVVIGENDGAIAPLLSVKVSRADWQANPNVLTWGREFPFSKSLLGFEVPAPPPPAPPAPTPPEAEPSDDRPQSSGNNLPGDALPTTETSPSSLPEQRLRTRPNNPTLDSPTNP